MADNEVEKLYEEFGNNFCVQPFINGFVDTINGRIRFNPCCYYTKDTKIKNQLTLWNDLNSENQLNLRKKHFNNCGLDSDGCKKCKNEESKKIKSLRQKVNQNQIEQLGYDLISNTVKNIQKNNFRISNLLSIEYVPSIYCGYACIMCRSDISSGRAALEKKLGKSFNFDLGNKPFNILETFKGIKTLHLHGGEPLAQPEIKNIIDQLIDMKLEKGIDLFIVTNLQKYNKELYSKLEKFKKTHITFSIDGVDKFFEYQRINSNWNKVENNLLTIVKNHQNINYFINYVVTAISLVSVPNFLKWAHNNGFQDVYFTYVFDAPHLTIDALEEEIVDDIKQQIEILEKQLEINENIKDFPNLFDQIYQIIKSHKFDKNVQRSLIKQMRLEDSVRSDNLKLFDVLPHLKNQYEQD